MHGHMHAEFYTNTGEKLLKRKNYIEYENMPGQSCSYCRFISLVMVLDGD